MIQHHGIASSFERTSPQCAFALHSPTSLSPLLAASATPGTSSWATIHESPSAAPSLCHELRNKPRGGRLRVADLCCGSRAPAQLRNVVLLTASGLLHTLRNTSSSQATSSDRGPHREQARPLSCRLLRRNRLAVLALQPRQPPPPPQKAR